MSDNLADFVTINITQDTLGVRRAGFGVLMVASANASFPERARVYEGLTDVLADFPVTTSPEYRCAQRYFSQNPRPRQLIIGRCDNKPTQKYELQTVQLIDLHEYLIRVKGEGVTDTDVSYSTAFEFEDLEVSNVDTTDNELDFAGPHGLATGDGPIRLTTDGAAPGGLAVDTDYWVINASANAISLAESRALALALTEIDISSAGTGIHTIVPTATTSHNPTNDLIVAGLRDELNLVVGKNFTASVTAGGGDTDTLVVTGDAAGEWFSLEVLKVADLEISQTHTDPGIAADIAAIQIENDDWYGLVTLYNSNAVVIAAAEYIETQKKIYIVDVNETDAITTATGNSDTLDDLKTAAYERTAGVYHPAPADFMPAAWFGKVFPILPGGETWAGKTLTGVTPTSLTGTHKTNLKNRRANFYYTVAGVNVTFQGTVPNSTTGYIDARRFFDWQEDDMSKAIFEAIAANNKIPYTDPGVAIIESRMRGSLLKGVSQGGIAEDPEFQIEVPLVADIDSADKALRLLPDMKFSFTYASAVHKVAVNGVVSL